MSRFKPSITVKTALISAFAGALFSCLAFAEADHLYRDLLKDVIFECDHFDELQNQGDRAKVEAFKKEWQLYLNEPARVKLPPSQLKLGDGRVYRLSFSTQTKPDAVPQDVSEVKLPRSLAGKESSMKDVEGYIANRLGPYTLETIKKNSLNVQVVGGEESVEGVRAKIPSFYEKWGIEKYLVTNSESQTLIIKVPPAKEYVKHYLGMLDAAGIKTARGFLNEISRQDLKKELESSAKKIVKTVGNGGVKPWVVLGYSSALENEVESAFKAGLVQNYQVHSEKFGHVGARVLKFQINNESRILIALHSDLTLWGEGSSFLVRGALEAGVSGVMFMGSAGSVSRKFGVYEFSAPSRFLDDQMNEIPVKNFLATPESRVVHAATYSPIEETIEHTDFLLSKNVDTIDVEVIRIAETIAEFKSTKKTPEVAFGVLNLITDLPISSKYSSHVEFNLDQISFEKKGYSKALIVRKFFKGWMSRTENLPCDGLLMKSGLK